MLKDPTQPLATILAAPEYGVTEKAVVVQHGGTDAPDAHDTDTATPWLNENSVGSGPYRLVGWQHNQQVQMVRNPRYWTSPKPGYQRLLIRHMSDGATQLLALTHGDLDAAFNLTAEQAATLKGNPEINVVRNQSLDYLYMAVAEAPDNPALQKQQARQAIGCAIDYDGIINGLAGGFAVRPAAFLPVGVNGSTAELTKQIGYHQDLARARQLLADAGLPEGFGFRLHYPSNAILAGVAYSDVAQKLQSDLAKVNIKVELAPTDLVNITRSTPPGGFRRLWVSGIRRLLRTNCGPRRPSCGSPNGCTGTCRRNSTSLSTMREPSATWPRPPCCGGNTRSRWSASRICSC